MNDIATTDLRRLPRQDRSTQRFELILNTTAALIDEVGFNTVTTSMVAKRAEMSGPGIYRYFDDLQAIARALAARNLALFVERTTALLAGEGVDNWQDALDRAVDVYCDLCRNEPGFRWLRLGDAIDHNLIDEAESNRVILSRQIAELFIERYEVDRRRPNLLEHVQVMVEIFDSIVARAFEKDSNGDEFFIAEGRRVIIGYLDEVLSRPIPEN